MIYFLQILRPINLFIIAVCVVLSALIVNKSPINIIPIMLVIILLAGFANIINDIIDYKIDQANKLNRPIASGKLSINTAIIYALILFASTLFVLFYYSFNLITLKLILCINIPSIILYTPFLKRIPLLGNFIVAFNLSMVFIITVTYLNEDVNLIYPLAILSFLLMFIREIVKDTADLEGDKAFNIATFPVQFGIDYTFRVIIFFSIILIIVSFYFTILYNFIYFISLLLLVVIPLIYYLYQLSKNKTATYCIYLSKVLKLITIFGVIVIYLASI